MNKINWQQGNRKTGEQIKGGMSLWDRITSDPAFIKMKREIQARYGLPLDYDIRLHHQEWMRWVAYDEKPTSQKAKRRRTFLSDVHELFKRFEIPESWHDDLIAEIAGSPYGDSAEEWSRPRFEIYKDNEGNWKWQCIITPETDLTNPVHIDLIKEQQKEWAGVPPKPVKDKADPRKLDWRPVYEWHKRHPLFTLEEIAKKIGYPAHRVRLKIASLRLNRQK